MAQLLEFIRNHAVLAGGTIGLAVIAAIIEIRHRLTAASSVGPADAVRLINKGAGVLDVRPAEAFADGHIIDARNIPQEALSAQADTLKKYREKPLIVYCDSGVRSAAAANALRALGFAQVVNLRGGIAAWKQDNLPVKLSGSGKNKGKREK